MQDFRKLMKQAREMQEQMQKVQEELAQAIVEALRRGGLSIEDLGQ